MKFVDVPEKYRKRICVNYPPHVTSDMIEGFAEHYFISKPDNDFTYIPFHWTAWHVNNGYGQAKEEARAFINSLPKGKYFTIAQYDGGTLIDETLVEKGCTTFVQDCTKAHNIIIPLLCDPHPEQFKRVKDPEYLCCFVGAFDTHPIRGALRDKFNNRPGFYFGRGDTNLFRFIMCNSSFCLCPRGSGITSFRMYEAMAMGVIPIYISDIHRKPFENKLNWNEFSLTFKHEEIDQIEPAIRQMSKIKIDQMSQRCVEVTRDYFNYEKTCDEIYRILGTL
jgi:hypothetical protein